MTRIAILDDWQGVARKAADWSALQRRAELVSFDQPFERAEDVAAALMGFEIVIAMRERTRFPAARVLRHRARRGRPARGQYPG